MSDPKETWNPEDGPPPTDDELDDARALADAIDAPAGSKKSRVEADLEPLRDVAWRVRATAHPDPAATKPVVDRAVSEAVEQAGRWRLRSRWTLVSLSAAAALAFGIGGVQFAMRGSGAASSPSISHAATDVYTAPIADHAQSQPIGQLTDARMRAYRNVVLRGGRTGRSR